MQIESAKVPAVRILALALAAVLAMKRAAPTSPTFAPVIEASEVGTHIRLAGHEAAPPTRARCEVAPRMREIAPLALPEPDADVTASWFDARLLVAWTPAHVYLSTDKGRSFRLVLDHAGKVASVGFDCAGRLFVARVMPDGTLLLGCAEHWARVGKASDEPRTVAIVPAGDEVAILVARTSAGNRLVLVYRGPDERWHTHRLIDLAKLTNYEGWDGVELETVAPRSQHRVRVLVNLYQGGECGYNNFVDAIIDPVARSIAARNLGER